MAEKNIDDFSSAVCDDSISGTVENIIYRNETNDYSVIEIDSGKSIPIVIVGTLPYVSEGDSITAYGEWTSHPEYGKQFRAKYFEKTLPSSTDDILRYLSSGAVRGIGPKTAQKIVEHFGEDSFTVIENHPDWLTELKISQKKAAAISENFREISESRNIIMFCKNICSPSTAMTIYKKWGDGAIDRIRQNPYSLCSINGITFKKADEIAESVGLAPNSPDRILAGVKYILGEEAFKNGHTCLCRDNLVTYASQLLSIDKEEISNSISFLLSNNLLLCRKEDKNEYIYDPRFYKAEKYISKKLTLINKLCPSITENDSAGFIMQLENTGDITYAPSQRQAIIDALSSGVMVLTGGPGTGKTTVIKGLLSIYESMGQSCALAAPTGRAAKRMSEATSHEAKTIHRLLEMEYSENKNQTGFSKDENNLLEEDVFIIDESSMLDTLLLESLLKAIKPGARIIFIGDFDQLPSVGPGNCLYDIIESNVFKVVKLVDIFRQSDESLIITNAHAVNHGEVPIKGGKDSDFFIMKRSSDNKIADTVGELVKYRLPKAYGEHVSDMIQIISPTRKGGAGTEILNLLLQKLLNPPDDSKSEKIFRDITFRCGDKVMQTRNNYSIEWTKDGIEGVGIFNGDIGIITKVDKHAEILTINFDDRITEYSFEFLEDLEHAYAITVHKSQGCEYPIVIIPLPNAAPMLLTRNMLYTAVTRASKMVIIVTREDSIEKMVSNNHRALRCTGLKHFLKEAAGTV